MGLAQARPNYTSTSSSYQLVATLFRCRVCSSILLILNMHTASHAICMHIVVRVLHSCARYIHAYRIVSNLTDISNFPDTISNYFFTSDYTGLVSYPAPKSPHGEGSGDIGTISWLHRRVISCQYYAINHAPVPRCYAMQCTIKELRSHWLALNRQLDIARSLLRDQMQGHMKIVELQSDWLSQK